jgi:hypothetical protein
MPVMTVSGRINIFPDGIFNTAWFDPLYAKYALDPNAPGI